MISVVATAITVPSVQSFLYYYRLRSAVASVTWAIQSTRFQALEQGYPYQVTITGTSSGSAFSSPSYQIASEPVGTSSFTATATAVPLSGSPVVLNAITVLQFKGNGSVSATTGSLSFTLTYQGNTKTVTVSNYGNVDVTP